MDLFFMPESGRQSAEEKAEDELKTKIFDEFGLDYNTRLRFRQLAQMRQEYGQEGLALVSTEDLDIIERVYGAMEDILENYITTELSSIEAKATLQEAIAESDKIVIGGEALKVALEKANNTLDN